MLTFSHDPEAGTIYCYFTELEEGQVAYSLEYPAHLLLDAAGQLIGLRIDLDDDITLDQLDLALDHPGVFLNERGHLRAAIGDGEPAQTIALEQTAILDLDEQDRVLGVELAAPEELRAPERLAALQPHMVALDETPAGGEGPVVFAPAPPAEPEAETQETETGRPGDRETRRPGDQETGSSASDAGGADEPDNLQSPISSPQLVRVGFVALVGKPNVGKSTLLNALLGQKVAIVSPHPQTTRIPLRGILNRPDAQVIFIDTPGIHDPRHKLGQFMVELAQRAIPNADVVCFMVDISAPPSRLDERIAGLVRRARGPRLLVLNKVDLRPRTPRDGDATANLEAYRALGPWDMELAVSARTGDGLETLLDEIVRRLPPGERLYPQEQVADQTEQQLAAELVREKVLYFTQQEVPHAVAIEVEEWNEKDQATYIRMSINVEREGQKGILIGAGGEMLKRIGSAARADIERMLGRRVFLDLWVKVRANWRDDPTSLGWLGYRLKDWR